MTSPINFDCYGDLASQMLNEASTTCLADIYLLKANNRNTRTRCEICSKLTIKIPERRHWRRSSIFIVNFEHFTPCSSVTIDNFEHVIAGWDNSITSIQFIFS